MFYIAESIINFFSFHILRSGYETGALSPGDMLAEATSGYTGIAISAIGRALGHPVTIYMPDWMSSERINLIRSLGATIYLVSKEEGGFLGSIKMTEELAKKGSVLLPKQFSNQENVNAHYASTGPEMMTIKNILVQIFLKKSPKGIFFCPVIYPLKASGRLKESVTFVAIPWSAQNWIYLNCHLKEWSEPLNLYS